MIKSDLGEYIEFTIKKRFGIITLNRVYRSNAFTIELLENLIKIIKYCQENQKIKGLIITNNGNSFSTGMDLDFIDGSNHAAVKKLEATAADICKILFYGKPSIAAINGRCMGEGVVFALSCDYRITLKDNFFYMPEIFSGIFPGTGCIILMARQIGIPWTKKMLMFAEKIDSQTALKIGLIDEITDSKQDLIKLSLKKAKDLSSRNQTFLNTIKICSNHLIDKTFSDAYEIGMIRSNWYECDDKKNYLEILKNRVA